MVPKDSDGASTNVSVHGSARLVGNVAMRRGAATAGFRKTPDRAGINTNFRQHPSIVFNPRTLVTASLGVVPVN
jgi:hypothetical protein